MGCCNAAHAGGGSAGGATDTADAEELRGRVNELDARVQMKEEILQKLRTTPSQPRKPVEGIQAMSRRELQDTLERLEEELDDREAEEAALHGGDRQNLPVLQRATSFTPALVAAAPAEAGELTEEERGHLEDPSVLLSNDFVYGLTWERRWRGKPMGPESESKRARCRENTMRKVAAELGLRRFGDPIVSADADKVQEVGNRLHAWIDRTPEAEQGAAPPGAEFLLGRYDVVVAQVVADMNRDWEFYKGRNRPTFLVAHAAAINIGELGRASDFEDFSRKDEDGSPSLLVESYLEAMGHVVGNVAEVVRSLSVKELVFFPFGMGAFVRHVGRSDPRFDSQLEMQWLRRQLARQLVQVIARGVDPTVTVHFCLSFADGEPSWNADAFLRALLQEDVKEFALRSIVHEEGDCLDLAQELAGRRGNRQNDVLMLNGANRHLLGNHWFQGGAKMAIDENLHRRCWRMARTSYCVNNYGKSLEETVRCLRGSVHVIGENPAVPAPRSHS